MSVTTGDSIVFWNVPRGITLQRAVTRRDECTEAATCPQHDLYILESRLELEIAREGNSRNQLACREHFQVQWKVLQRRLCAQRGKRDKGFSRANRHPMNDVGLMTLATCKVISLREVLTV
jgi:hypothetical protein